MPQVVKRIADLMDLIPNVLMNELTEAELSYYWETSINSDRFSQWLDLIDIASKKYIRRVSLKKLFRMDIWTRGKGQEVMAKIRGRIQNQNCWFVVFVLKGYRYRIHVKHLPGTPDIVLPKYNVVIFVHGCFWHGHAVDGRLPHSNLEFWASKIKHNKRKGF